MTGLINDHLEQQYNNRAAVADFADYLNSWLSRSDTFRAAAKGVLNIPYGKSKRQLLDIFPLETSRKSPVHVFIHGGYWQALDKDSFSFMAEAFNQQAECAVIINYDLCPAVNLIDIIQQLKQAMLWICDNIADYGGDPRQIQITGHSAGAHLLATLLTTDWSELGLDSYPFQRLNALSGLYDMQPLLQTSVNKALSLDQMTAKWCSPLFSQLWNPSKSISLNLMVGELESGEYKKQSQQLINSWQDQLDMSYLHLPATHHFSILDKFLGSNIWKST